MQDEFRLDRGIQMRRRDPTFPPSQILRPNPCLHVATRAECLYSSLLTQKSVGLNSLVGDTD